MTTNITTVINGIEIKTMGDGTVEVYSDRPSLVRIKDLVEVLTSTETSERDLIVFLTLECKRRDTGFDRFSRFVMAYKKHDRIQ